MKTMIRLRVGFFLLLFSLSCSIVDTYDNGFGSKNGPLVQKYSDEEIKEAFEASPQLRLPLKLAIYNAGFQYRPLIDSLRTLSVISDVFPISPLLLEGDFYYHRQKASRWSRYGNPEPVDVKQLRMRAAEAKADLLLVYGIALTEVSKTNGKAWTYLLILPTLFVHGNDFSIMAEAELYFIDVRTGYIYASNRLVDKIEDGGVSWPRTTDQTYRQQWRLKLMNKMTRQFLVATNSLLNNKDWFLTE